MIIVEGCDNSGKTTLVAKLCEDLRLLTICNRQRPPTRAKSWVYLKHVAPITKDFPTILDRWQPISEPVYGPICRNVRMFNAESIAAQHKWLLDHGSAPLVIYCRPSLQRIMNWGDRPQMAGVIENARSIIEQYDIMMSWLNTEWFPVVRYDFERDSYDDIKSRALAHLQGVFPT